MTMAAYQNRMWTILRNPTARQEDRKLPNTMMKIGKLADSYAPYLLFNNFPITE